MSELSAPPRRSAGIAPALLIGWLVAAIWLAEALDTLLPVDADFWGIQARTLDGLVGVALSPLLAWARCSENSSKVTSPVPVGPDTDM